MRIRNAWTILAVFLLLVAGEAGLRFLGFGSPLLYRASEAGYEVAPSQRMQRLLRPTSYNSFGTRNRELSLAPEPGATRLMILGDSITNGGTQVSNDETIAGQLEAMLPNSQVLNASAGGWSLLNASSWLKSHGLFGSTAIILEVGENDLFQSFARSSVLDANVSFPSTAPWTAAGEVVFRYVLPRAGLTTSQDPGVQSEGSSQELAENAFQAARDIADYAALHGAKLILLYMDPAVSSKEPEAEAARARLLNWAVAAKIPVVRPRLDEAQARGERLFRDELHPNAAGNSVTARALHREFKRLSGWAGSSSDSEKGD